MRLCRIDQRTAEHLMMAPAVAGGWVAVDEITINAVEDALERSRGRGPRYASYLALLAPMFDDVPARDITPAEALAVAASLERWAESERRQRRANGMRTRAAAIRAAVVAEAQ